MIEYLSPTGARHLSIEAPPRRGGLVLAPRTILLVVLILLALAAIGGGFFLHRQVKGPVGSDQATDEGIKAAQALPSPDLLRPLTPEAAIALNAERPIVASAGQPASSFRLSGEEISRLRAIDCLTQAIYYEAASEGVDGGRAVAQVVLNRVRHPAYPNSVCGVVYQGSERVTGCQFTFTCDGSLARTPMAYLWARSRMIAAEALAGRVFAAVGLSTHYHADYVLPYWADSLDKTAVVGRHIFYRFRGAAGSPRAFGQRYAGRESMPAPPTTEVIEQSLDTLENAVAPAVSPEEVAVEEDRVETLGPSPAPVLEKSAPVEADLERGQLILGEPDPTPRPRPTTRTESGCRPGSGRIQPMGSTVTRVGEQAAAC